MRSPLAFPQHPSAQPPELISVGGPGGITVRSISAPLPQAGWQASRDHRVPDLAFAATSPGDILTLLQRHAALVRPLASAVALLVVAGAATVVAAFSLPWLLLAPPAFVSTAILASGWGVSRRLHTAPSADAEHRILDLAAASGGRLTVTSVARSLAIPLDRADEALMRLARAGHADITNDPDTGVVVYSFPELRDGLTPLTRSP